MKASTIARFVIIGLIWAGLCAMLLLRSERITLYLILVIVISAIIVFVPMYKKYVKNDR